MKGHGSDGDAQSEVAVRGQAAHRAAVSASFLIFQFIDDLHGPDLWRAGNRARGEGCPEEIANRSSLFQFSGNFRKRAPHVFELSL